GLSLSNRRIESCPLSDQCPGRTVLIEQSYEVFFTGPSRLLSPLPFSVFNPSENSRWLRSTESPTQFQSFVKRQMHFALSITLFGWHFSSLHAHQQLNHGLLLNSK